MIGDAEGCLHDWTTLGDNQECVTSQSWFINATINHQYKSTPGYSKHQKYFLYQQGSNGA